MADKLHSVITRDDSSVILTTNRSEFRRRNFSTDFRITVPSGMAVEVTNSYGPVRADQMGETTIDNRHGKVTATNIQAGTVVENSFEDVDVSGIQANCTIRSQHSDIKARSIEGETNIENSYGLIDIRATKQTVTITGPHCEILGEDLPGPVKVRNTYEKITLRNVGPVSIDGSLERRRRSRDHRHLRGGPPGIRQGQPPPGRKACRAHRTGYRRREHFRLIKL